MGLSYRTGDTKGFGLQGQTHYMLPLLGQEAGNILPISDNTVQFGGCCGKRVIVDYKLQIVNMIVT